jgi:hypothetical protein
MYVPSRIEQSITSTPNAIKKRLIRAGVMYVKLSKWHNDAVKTVYMCLLIVVVCRCVCNIKEKSLYVREP